MFDPLFDDLECSLTFCSSAVSSRTLAATNPTFMHIPSDRPAQLDVGEADPVLFANKWRAYANAVEEYAYFQKAVARSAQAGDFEAANTSALVAARSALSANASTLSWSKVVAKDVSSLLNSVFHLFIFPRVGPQCAARLRGFKEDRTLPLQLVHERFLAIASMARDVTVREARRLFIDGIEADDARSWLSQWAVQEALARRHVSVEQLMTRHYEFAVHMNPERAQPASTNVRSIESTVVCWACNEPGHKKSECPKRPLHAFRPQQKQSDPPLTTKAAKPTGRYGRRYATTRKH